MVGENRHQTMKGDQVTVSDIAINSFADDMPAPGGRVQPANHSGWLAQLETAQWQQRLRYQPHGGQPLAACATREDTPGKTSARAPKLPPMAETMPGAPHQESPTPTPGSNNTLPARSVTTATRLATANQAMACLPTPPEQVVIPGGEDTAEMALQGRRPQSMQWQAHHMHAVLNQEGVCIWLRDARYRDGDGQQLLRTLRSQFARLGLRLAQFTLNGSQIAEPDHIG